MPQHEQFVALQLGHGNGSPLKIEEFHLEHVGSQHFNHGADCPETKPSSGLSSSTATTSSSFTGVSCIALFITRSTSPSEGNPPQDGCSKCCAGGRTCRREPTQSQSRNAGHALFLGVECTPALWPRAATIIPDLLGFERDALFNLGTTRLATSPRAAKTISIIGNWNGL